MRGLFRALNDRDVDAIVTEFYAPDAEFMPALEGELEGTVYRGTNRLRAFYDDLYSVWEFLRAEISDVREVGDVVLARGRVTARGKSSGVDLDRSWTYALRLADGKIVWHRNFLDHAEALEALELRP